MNIGLDQIIVLLLVVAALALIVYLNKSGKTGKKGTGTAP